METATLSSSIQLALSPGTVYITTIAGQSSFANLTLTVTNTGNAAQVESVGILLPTNLYSENSLSSILPLAGQPSIWNFGTSSPAGAFQATPSAPHPVPLPAGASFTFMLNNITLAQQTGIASVKAVVKLSDGTKIPQTFTVTMAEATASIAAFTAEPSYIDPGQNTTLNWDCPGMAYCILTPPNNNNQLPATGSAEQSLIASTTYTLDAYGTDLQLQAQVNVQVRRPQVVTFSAESNTIDYNAHAYLSWETQYADKVQLTAVPQTVIPGNLPKNTITPIQVGPLTQATSFTLIPISNTIPGSDSSPLNIDINPPTATFTASPTENVWGLQEVTISWDITNAASVTVDPPLPGGPSVENLNGSVAIYPDADVNYTLTVNGAPHIAPVTKIVSFNVTPATIEFLAVLAPNPITRMEFLTLLCNYTLQPGEEMIFQIYSPDLPPGLPWQTIPNVCGTGKLETFQFNPPITPIGSVWTLAISPLQSPTPVKIIPATVTQ